MAVAPTGAIYKALEFDGVSSRTYGVYITGEAVYNAPERDVEMIAIPGRNGSFALDKGRFENIEVSYPAGIFADAESDFAEAVSDFRNFLCSRNGYVRLQDEYNPNEYRMAVYKSGLEVTPAQLKAGEFNIVFECKPQRWLTSGESAVTVGEWSDWETESGPIVEIEASETDKVKSLSVALEPIQDLHGYDKPWSGGAGKNLFDYEAVTELTGFSNNDGVFTNTHTDSRTDFRFTVQWINGNTVVGTSAGSGAIGRQSIVCNITDAITLLRIKHNGSSIDLRFDYPFTQTGTFVVSLTVTANNPSVVGGLSFKDVMIEEGSTATSYAPWENICPISGRTECVTEVSGVNVWDEEWELGAINATTGQNANDTTRIRTKNYIHIIPSRSYFFAIQNYSGQAGTICFYDKDKAFIGVDYTTANSALTVPNNAHYMRIGFYPNYGTTYNHDISINYPSTDTDYHAYSGTSYTTDLGRTVYGGTLDVVSGVLTVDRAIVDLGSLSYSEWGSDDSVTQYYTTALDSLAKSLGSGISSVFTLNVSKEPWTFYISNGTAGKVYFRTPKDYYNSPSAFKTAMDGVQLCYELATPQTYQLTPTEVALIKGQNNVWSNGDVTLEYGQDPNVIVNPTLFEASPLLIAEGTGKITVNGTDIRIQNSVVGDCGLCYDLNVPGNYYLAGFTNIYIATGDIIETESINYAFAIYNADSSYTFTSQSITNVTGNPDVLPDATDLPGGEAVVVTCRLDDESYSFGTALSKTIGFDVNITNSNGDSATIHVEVTAAYDGNKIIEYSAFVGYVPEAFYLYNPMFQFTAAPSITIHSTAATFGNPTYIDCDIGEAYADLGGTISPLNRYIELGSKLPTLAIGNTEITFDNTIATLKVVPRWWKI